MPTGCRAAWACSPPLIKPKGIDDVPDRHADAVQPAIAAIGAYDLERVAHSLEAELKRVPGTREVITLGGPGRAVLVELDPARLASAGVTVADLRQALQAANLGAARGRAGGRQPRRGGGGRALPAAMRRTWASSWSACATASRSSCRTWPTVRDGPLPPRSATCGTAWRGKAEPAEYPAVTLSITKKPGENAIDVAIARDAARRGAAQHA